MRILAIVSRDLEKGSTKYRLAQYLDYLAEQGAKVEFVRRDEISNTTVEMARRADLLFNQKCLIRIGIARKLIAASRRVVFDFDDAIYTRPGRPFSRFTQLKVNRRLRYWLEHATVVTPANDYLATFARRYTSEVEVLPMALDLQAWKPLRKKHSDAVTIGWAGAPVNVHLLEKLEPVLARLLERCPQARLAVFSGKKPQLKIPFDYQPFGPGAEAEFVANLDIGLLPLADEEFTRGKSPIKSLQYLACGVPVVGNVFGATAELLQLGNSFAVSGEDQWLTALEQLILSPELRRSMGLAGRQMVEQRHDIRKTEKDLWRILTRFGSGRKI